MDAAMEEHGDPVELCRASNDQYLMTMQDFAGGLLKIGKMELAKRSFWTWCGTVTKSRFVALRSCYPRICCVAKRRHDWEAVM